MKAYLTRTSLQVHRLFQDVALLGNTLQFGLQPPHFVRLDVLGVALGLGHAVLDRILFLEESPSRVEYEQVAEQLRHIAECFLLLSHEQICNKINDTRSEGMQFIF